MHNSFNTDFEELYEREVVLELKSETKQSLLLILKTTFITSNKT